MANPIAVAILGAGTEGTDLLTALLNIPGIEVLLVADRDSESPGFKIADAAGVPTTTDPVRLSVLDEADAILDASGDALLLGPILRRKSLKVRLIGRAVTRLLHRVLSRYREGQAQVLVSERMALMGNLLAAAAHELNNPLFVVTGYCALADVHARDGDVVTTRADLHKLAEASDRLLALTERFLKFGRPAPQSNVMCDVNKCVREIERMLAHDLHRHDIRFVTTMAAAVPPVLADPQAVQEVLVNLISNAREAISEARQGYVVTCETTVVSDLEEVAGSGDAGRYIQIRVGDDGPGIAPAHLPHIFEPLYTTKGPGPHTGMGLAVCYGIVRALGGTIACESKLGQGTLFTVRLPAASAAPAAA